MMSHPQRYWKRSLANFFGAIAYLICFLQWFWAIMLYFNVLQSFTLFVMPHADKHVERTPVVALSLPGPLEVIILTIVAITMFAVTIYVLIKMPFKIAKASNQVVHKTTAHMAPIIIKAQHKKDTKRLRLRITARLVLVIKLLLIAAPIALAAASGLLDKLPINYSIGMIVGCSLAGLSMLFFAIQYTIASLFHIKIADLW